MADGRVVELILTSPNIREAVLYLLCIGSVLRCSLFSVDAKPPCLPSIVRIPLQNVMGNRHLNFSLVIELPTTLPLSA
jgi:hypothetical protein